MQRAELALKRAAREPVPDLFIRGGPRYNRELLEIGPRGNIPVGWEGAIEVGLTIPLFNRNQGSIAAARRAGRLDPAARLSAPVAAA